MFNDENPVGTSAACDANHEQSRRNAFKLPAVSVWATDTLQVAHNLVIFVLL